MQAIIKQGYTAFYLAFTGCYPQFGDESLVEVVAVKLDGAIVELGQVRAFIPAAYLEYKGVQS